MSSPPLRILVTGATGYIGGRLAPLLIDAGHRVRVLARTPDKLRDVPWAGDVEIVRGDLTDPESLAVACRDIDVLYYLVHSMGGRGEFIDTERAEAENVAAAARAAGVQRIVYLGGLHPDTADLSTHLRSREQVGRILVESGVPTLVLQAGVVIGSGSASFEMIRHLSNRLPLMTTPKWVNNKIQPIAVRDVLHYLVGAATAPLPRSRTYDIGGPDVLRYGEMMQVYAEVAGLRRRRILVLPVLTPKLAGLWIGLVTPIPPSLGRALIESLSNDAVVAEHDIDEVIPPPPGGLTGYREAVRLALHKLERGDVETTWASASPVGAPAEPLPSDPHWAGRRSSSTSALSTATPTPARCGRWSRASAARTAGTPSRSPGRSAGGSTGSPAASVCPGAAGTRAPCTPGTRSTSGASSASNVPPCCGCGPRCGRRAGRGSSGASSRSIPAGPGCTSGRSSFRKGLQDGSTGMRSCRSTASSSRACSRTSPAPRTARRGRMSHMVT